MYARNNDVYDVKLHREVSETTIKNCEWITSTDEDSSLQRNDDHSGNIIYSRKRKIYLLQKTSLIVHRSGK